MPKVSVIIPNYNHARYLTQRIESVLGQTFQDFELIILDDFSTDDSHLVIERYRDNGKVTHIVFNNQNSGSTFKQWEKGFLLAKGEWIWIAESDDYCEAIFLQSLVNLITQGENVGIAFGNSYWVDDNSKIGAELSIYNKSFFRCGTDEVKNGMAKHCTIQNASACLIKREYALQAIKGLGKYKACGDWVFYTRVLQNANLAYTDQKINYFRWYHNNVSNNAKDRLWITEGVDVLKNINFNRVHFNSNEFLQTIKIWIKRTRTLSIKDVFFTWIAILYSAVKFYLSGNNYSQITNKEA